MENFTFFFLEVHRSEMAPNSRNDPEQHAIDQEKQQAIGQKFESDLFKTLRQQCGRTTVNFKYK